MLVKMYPKVDFFVCEKDPLHDDAIRMGKLIIKNQGESDILVFKNAPHGMLNFDVPNGLPSAKIFVEKSIQYLHRMFEYYIPEKNNVNEIFSY